MTVSLSRARKVETGETNNLKGVRSRQGVTKPLATYNHPDDVSSVPMQSLVTLEPEPEEYDARIYIHPTADVSPQAQIGLGCRIWQQVQIRERAIIGSQCNIGKAVYIDRDVVLGNCVKIQNYVSICQGVMIESGAFIGPNVTFTNDRYPRSINPEGKLKGEGDWDLECIIVGYGASIGAGAVILPGVRIGAFAMIGAGAVVTKDVAEQRLVMGNPAQLVGYVCRCGRPLQLTKQPASWYCASCRETYVFHL